MTGSEIEKLPAESEGEKLPTESEIKKLPAESETETLRLTVKKNAAKKERRVMTVREMGDLLGLKKTERYYLLHKNCFATRIIAGQTWVDCESFEHWYANQVRYHKVSGEKPGQELISRSYSARDIGELLGISEARAYELIQEKKLETILVNDWKRVPKEAFDQWYAGQHHYRTAEDRMRDRQMEKATISIPEAAALLGISRERIYSILRDPRYADLLETVRISSRRRITKRSFLHFLAQQNDFKLISEKTSYAGTDKDASACEGEGAGADAGKGSCAGKGACEGEDEKSYEGQSDDFGIRRDFYEIRNQSSTASNRAGDQYTSQDIVSACAALADSLRWKDFLSLAEAAALAGISRQAISKFADRGAFRRRKLCGVVRIRREDFETWLLARQRKLTVSPAGQLQINLLQEGGNNQWHRSKSAAAPTV